MLFSFVGLSSSTPDFENSKQICFNCIVDNLSRAGLITINQIRSLLSFISSVINSNGVNVFSNEELMFNFLKALFLLPGSCIKTFQDNTTEQFFAVNELIEKIITSLSDKIAFTTIEQIIKEIESDNKWKSNTHLISMLATHNVYFKRTILRSFGILQQMIELINDNKKITDCIDFLNEILEIESERTNLIFFAYQSDKTFFEKLLSVIQKTENEIIKQKILRIFSFFFFFSFFIY